jgi:hypothetical protein
MRVCKYEVVAEYQGELLKPLYSCEFSYENDYDCDDEELDDEYWNQFDDYDEEDDEDDEYEWSPNIR